MGLMLARPANGVVAPICPRPDAPTDYNVSVEKRVRVFKSFQDADDADARADAAMSCQERLNLLMELRDSRHPDAAEQRMARVCRVVKLERS